MSLKSWPSQERPREKLLDRGVAQLTDAELVAVMLGKGIAGKNALALARDLLSHVGSVRELVSASKNTFLEVHGLGECKYAQFQAAFEIFRRYLEMPLRRQNAFTNAEDTKQFLSATLRDCEQEKFAMLMLDSQHQLIIFRVMFVGTINAAAVYPRELVKQVMRDNAAAVILVHNHPSGIAEPSHADIAITRAIKTAMQTIDVEVLDHFIVGDKEIISLAQQGLIH